MKTKFKITVGFLMLILVSWNVSAYSGGGGTCGCGDGTTALGGSATDACMDCNDALNDNANCSNQINYVGTVTISNYAGTCIDNPANFTNKTFDCQGNTIDGTGTHNTYGIYLNGKTGNTIKNCNITDFYNGIYLYDSSNNNVINNTANDNVDSGIYTLYSSNNNLMDNTANLNKYGIFLDSSLNNILKNNAMNDNIYNFYIEVASWWNQGSPSFYQDIDTSNTIDEKPIYYWTDKKNGPNNCSNAEIPLDAGFVALVSCDNITVKNLNLHNNSHGILLINTTSSRILNNTLSSNDKYGIYLSYSASNNLIDNNASSNNANGIHLYYSSNNTVIDNKANDNNAYGIYLYYSSNNTLANNTANSDRNSGIYLEYSSNNTVDDNTANDTIWDNGIYLKSSSNNTVINNTVKGNRVHGIYLEYSSNNNVINNNASSNDQYGIGIELYFSSNNNVINNTVNSNNHYGIKLDSSSNSNIINNNISSNNDYGIYMNFASNNTLKHNTINNHTYNLHIHDFNLWGTDISHAYHDIDSSNTVDEKPIYYWTNKKNGPNNCSNAKIPLDAGFVALVSCDNITVKNLNLSKNSHGILLANTTNSKILNNTVNLNEYEGILLRFSSNNNIISNNTASSNDCGIHLDNSSNNIIINNTVKYSTPYSLGDGIYLSYSSNNTVNDNIVSLNNDNGIYLSYSSNNTVDDNTVNDNLNGIYLSYSSNNTVDDNAVNDNIAGIQLHYSLNTTIINNTVNSNYHYGIYLHSSSSYNTIINNTVNDTGAYDGIYLEGESSNNNIINNTIINNDVAGIRLAPYFSPSPSHNNIINNTINSNEYGIYLYTSLNNTIEENKIFNNSNIGIYSETSNNTINSNIVCRNINYDFYSPSLGGEFGYGDNNTCDKSRGWGDGKIAGCTYSCDLCISSKLTVSNIPETYSQNSTFVEDIEISSAKINVSVSGNLSGIINFVNYEFITIGTGSFAGKGFSKGEWNATLSGDSYNGTLKAFSFFRADEKIIYIKGTISGDITGIVEGYLTESVNESNVYDQLYATWKFNRLKDQIYSGKINLNGTVNYQNISNSSVELYVLQTSIEGTTQGNCAGALETVITHVRMVNGSYQKEGFSIISYISDSGAGEGWTYDKLSGNKIEMNGMFTDPLLGIVYATLDESTTPRKLTLRIERLGIGESPISDLKVKLWGPKTMSPGETVDYIVEYRNDGVMIAEDVVVVVQLPYTADYVSSTSNGIYHSGKHQAFWLLGSVEPKKRGHLTVKVRYDWALGAHSFHEVYPLIGTSTTQPGYTNLPNIQEYITYDPVKIVSAEVLPTDEVAAALAVELSDSKISDHYNYANELGFNYVPTITRLILGDGSKITEITMMNGTNHSISITKLDTNGYTVSFLVQYLNDTLLMFNRSGGMSYNIINGSYFGWGTWNIPGSPTYWQCVENGICMKGSSILESIALDLWLVLMCAAPEATITKAACIAALGKKGYDATKTCSSCKLPNINAACAECLSTVIDSVPGIGQITTLAGIYYACIDTNAYPTCTECVPGSVESRCGYPGYFSDILPDEVYERVCYADSGGTWGDWEMGYGGRSEKRRDCQKKARERGMTIEGSIYGVDAVCHGGEYVCINTYTGEIITAHDPNIKYGPEGYVLPGQKLNYTVEFENEGEGIAFGVYFQDTLDEDLNDSTLEIGQVIAISNDTAKNGTVIGNGTYNPQTRTITWRIWGGDYSEVKSKEGGYANLNVSVRSNASRGTDIINYAAVYFPSAYEITLTNGIVSIVAIYGVEGNGICNCSSCMDCTAALDDNINCYDEVKLAADITNQSEICINDPKNANNKIFDCQGNEIEGTGWNYGIYLKNKANNTIRNCVINNFNYGIYLENSSGNTLERNEISDNGIGIYSQNSSTSINSNIVCDNNLDFSSFDWLTTSGNENICDNSGEWNDTGTTGCTLTCQEYMYMCDLNNDGIITNDYNDLMSAYKCFLGIKNNCDKIKYQNWNLIEQEYQCFIKK